MLIEERVEELYRCRREGLEEGVLLFENLCIRAVDNAHLLTVVCDHVFAVMRMGLAGLAWIILQVLAVEFLVGLFGLERVFHVLASLFVRYVLGDVEAFFGDPGIDVSFS